MKLKDICTSLVISVIYCASCSVTGKETSQNKVHYFSKNDTSFLFPDHYRDTGYSHRDLEHATRYLGFFNEHKLHDADSLKQYIRLLYWRSFHDPVIVRLQKSEVVFKSAKLEDLETTYDSTVLTENEWELLKAYHNYGQKFDSPDIRNQIVTHYPEIKNDRQKIMYLEFIKSQFPKGRSVGFTEKTKFIKEHILNELLIKLDSINFWSMNREYSEPDTDGSAFVLEVKNGDKYKIVECNNCLLDELIAIRNEMLKKFTNLGKDKIY